MAQRKRINYKKQQKRAGSGPSPYAPTLASSDFQAPRPPVEFGKAFVVMEDRAKNTFIYNGSNWVPHTKSIAEIRTDSQVKELPQKLNDKTRYEVREPI